MTSVRDDIKIENRKMPISIIGAGLLISIVFALIFTVIVVRAQDYLIAHNWVRFADELLMSLAVALVVGCFSRAATLESYRKDREGYSDEQILLFIHAMAWYGGAGLVLGAASLFIFWLIPHPYGFEIVPHLAVNVALFSTYTAIYGVFRHKFMDLLKD